jgi:hypothetical protein
LVDILLVLILGLDFAFSLWNAYASGYDLGMLGRARAGGWQGFVAYCGLGLAYVGMAYVMAVVLSLVAYYLGYVSQGVASTVLAFAFLVFGALIIGFSAIVTVQSIIIAARRRNLWSIAIALWNSFAEIWDIAVYVESFGDAVSILKGDRSQDDQGYVIIVIIVALLIAFFITHAAYKHGQKKGMAATNAPTGF